MILIFGVAGACRRQELVSLSTTCVEDSQTHFLIKLLDTKTKHDRSFTIVPGGLENVNLLEVVRAYVALRPAKTSHNRFFVNYAKEKCTVQPVGIHKIGGVPGVVAKFLNLENSSSYTGHCFRRTSATLLANAGASMDGIKRHGGWRSSTVAEGYVDDSESNKVSVASKILGRIQPDHFAEAGGSSKIAGFVSHQASGRNISNNKDCVITINHYHNYSDL